MLIAPGHSKISRNPGTPTKVGSFLCIEVSGFQFPIDRRVYDQTHPLSNKVVSENWQEKSKIFYSIYAIKHCSLKGCEELEYLRAGLDLLSLMKCCRLRGVSEDCKGTRQKAGFVYRPVFAEQCGVVVWKFRLALFCEYVKA